jgi:hypothetical protein
MENKETKDFSNEVRQIIENLKPQYEEDEQFKREYFLIRLGLYTKDSNGIKQIMNVTEEEYQALLKYKDWMNEADEHFSGLLKVAGAFSLTAGIIAGLFGIFYGFEMLLLVIPGFVLFLVLYGLGIVVENSYKRK